MRSSVSVSFLCRADAEPLGEFREDLDVRPRFSRRFHCRPDELQRDWTVALRDVVVFKERRGRKDHVGVSRRVGEDLLVHDREEVVALQPLEHPVLVGHRRQRVAVVDEEHVDRRVLEVEKRAPQMVHVDEPRGRLGRVVHPGLGLDAEGGRVAHRVSAAAHLELAGDGRQREDGRGRAAAVAVALEAPAAADERRASWPRTSRRGVEIGGVDARHFSRALEGPFHGARAQAIGAPRVCLEKLGIRVSRLEQVAMQRERHREVGPGTQGNVQVGLTRERRGARIDDHQARTRFARLLDERDEVNAGGARIDAPEDDQFCVHVVGVRDARHLAVETLVGRAGWRGTDSPVQPRRAESAEEHGVIRVLRQQSVRTAVRERQDRLGADGDPESRSFWPRCGRALPSTSLA